MSDPVTPESKPERKSFEEFLQSVPEPPSSSKTEAVEATAEEAPATEEGKAGAESAGTPETPTPSATPSKTSASADASPSTGDLDPATLRAALASGDLDALAEALGEDPALYSEKSTKWAASRRKEQKLKNERDTVAKQAEAIVQRTAPVYELAGAVQQGDFLKGPELVQYLTGMDYDTFVMKVARARHGSDPQVEVLKRRVAELEPVVAERTAAKQTAAERAFMETLRDEVAVGHQVRALDGWEAKVAAVLKESVDEDLGEPTLSAKQAADRVLRREREEFEKRAKVFGGGATPAKPKGAKAPERASGAAGAKVRKMTRDEWLAAQK